MTSAHTSVVILAAGRGARMRALTDATPKPLLKVGEHYLIEHHLFKLSAAGFKQVVVNIAYLGQQIQQVLGSGAAYNLDISYSDESDTGALETAGGLRQALTLIDSDPFLVINADIFTDYDFTEAIKPFLNGDKSCGRLVLVNNPPHNPAGDFVLKGTGDSRTFSGIAIYRKSMFDGLLPGKRALGPILKKLVNEQKLELVEYSGRWTDVGTPERLARLNAGLDA